MSSAGNKTRHESQMDLPLDRLPLDPFEAVRPLSTAPPANKPKATENALAAPDAEHLDRPDPVPMKTELVVATLPEDCFREAELSAGMDPDTRGNLYRSSEVTRTTPPFSSVATPQSVPAKGHVGAPRSRRAYPEPTRIPDPCHGECCRIPMSSSTGRDQDAVSSVGRPLSIAVWFRLLPLLRALQHAAKPESP